MKARTKLEHQIEALSKTMPPITDRHIKQAKEKSFIHEAWKAGRNTNCFCTECGHEFYTDAQEGEIVCPDCGHPLTIKKTRRQKLNETKMFAVVTTHCGWQVVRYIEIKKHLIRGAQRPVIFEHCEVARCWINETGKSRFQAVSISYNFFCSSFRYSTPLTLRPEEKNESYDFLASGIYSPQRFLPIVKRNGYDGHVGKDSPSWVIKQLLKNKYYETLYKAGYRDFLYHTQDVNDIELNWPSLKICMRNHYKPAEAGLWFDMMRNIRVLGLDDRSSHYVCPADLKAMHDEMQRRVEQMRAREREEQLKKDMRKDTKTFNKKKAFFGICFGNENVKVTVLKSLQEYEEEGKAMHHCVFTNRYFAKSNTIILSAKDANGLRVATIEFSLKNYKVLQCRAACNQKPERYDEIVRLVESHARDFKKAQKKGVMV